MAAEESRYIIGVDLGTTNSCVYYVDTDLESNPSLSIQRFEIPQLTSQDVVRPCATLPSFCYLPADFELSEGAGQQPWTGGGKPKITGRWAKDLGALTPSRLVESAKSWLCHGAVDRKERILPPTADDKARISPVEATAAYLSHLREAWNHQMARTKPEREWEQQEIVLTVPASFDEVARRLTVEAARLAGFEHLTLLEEPQAAFYSWIASNERSWKEDLKPGDKVVVCDVGGGTTDFSLIVVEEKDGDLAFQRTSVGQHLLLGGDNMDQAVSHLLESEFEKLGIEIQGDQWAQLRHQARFAKETLLQDGAPPSFTAVLQGVGASVVGGSSQVTVSREQLTELLLEGFFTKEKWEDSLKLRKGSGLQAMGLPYESEPSITKHLAAFLESAGHHPVEPDYIVFNGGTMTPSLFRDAVLESIQGWFGKRPLELQSHSLDCAVARGAAYHGKARRGLGVKIRSGLPRSYYLALESSDGQRALTLMERGAEPGAVFVPENHFHAWPNRPVAFTLYTSHTRLGDLPGDLLEIDEEQMQALPPIHTVLKWGKQQAPDKQIPVQVKSELTELGTLSLWLEATETPHRWNLEFQVRSAGGQDDSIKATDERVEDRSVSAHELEQATALVRSCFCEGIPKGSELMKELEELLGESRWEWPISFLRSMGDVCLDLAQERKRSPQYEARWWNLVGFFLRPGFGYPLDDHRGQRLWKLILAEQSQTLAADVETQFWICMRRVSAGLNKGKQQQLAARLLGQLLPKGSKELQPGKRALRQLYEERVRALGALELMEQGQKRRYGQNLVKRLRDENTLRAESWALARVGARRLLRGSAAHVVSAEICGGWVEELLKKSAAQPEDLRLVYQQLAQQTGERELDLPENLVQRLPQDVYKRNKQALSRDQKPQEQEEQLWGDRLPVGLALIE